IRFTGVALVFNVSFTAFSGTAPLVATTLIRALGTETGPALLMIGCGLLALGGSVWLRNGGYVLAPDRRTARRARRSGYHRARGKRCSSALTASSTARTPKPTARFFATSCRSRVSTWAAAG